MEKSLSKHASGSEVENTQREHISVSTEETKGEQCLQHIDTL